MKLHKQFLSSRRRGVTLVETLVSIGIMSILFSASAGTFVLGARAIHAMHKQSMSQSRASAAMERIANLLRNATEFAPYGTDAPADGILHRLRFAVPDGTDVYNPRWGTIYFTPADETSIAGDSASPVNGHINVVWDSTEITSEGYGAWNSANMELPGVTGFGVRFESPQQVSLQLAFYQPSMKERGHGRLEDNVFVTDVTAKTHFLLEGLGGGLHL